MREHTALDLILGVGLVGDALAQAIALLPGWTVKQTYELATDWSSPASLVSSLEKMLSILPTGPRLRLFWCAGKAGFASSAAQCEAELRSFEAVLDFAKRIAATRALEFHLTSSAGGLHEGQTLVTAPSPVNTTRPYAALKLQQEERLHASGIAQRFVYRLSSVYGLPIPGRRMGLIPTLVVNALRHQPSLITAHASTLRDFVTASDVGRFMAREEKPTTASTTDGVHYLVAGAPISIWALQRAVEKRLLRRIRVSYSSGKENFASTTFSAQLKPARWEVSSVEANLARIVLTAEALVRKK